MHLDEKILWPAHPIGNNSFLSLPFLLAFSQVERAPSLELISHRFEMLGWVGEGGVMGVGWEFGESFIPCFSKAVRLLRGGNDW